MARSHRVITSFFLHALPGTLVGAALGALAGLLVVTMEPARMEASVVLFHTPGSGLSDSGRDFVAATLAQPDFLADAVEQHGWDANLAAQLAAGLSVDAEDASRPLAELRLAGNDAANLTTTLDAIADRMESLHREKQRAQLHWQSSELDKALEDITRRQRELEATRRDDTSLPRATREAIADVARLVRERRELELAGRYRLRQGSRLQESNRQRRLSAIAAQQKRTRLTPGADIVVDPAQFGTEYALAIIEAQRHALTQTLVRLSNEYNSFKPLQIVRRAEASPVIVDRAPIASLAAVGCVIGLLAGGVIWSMRYAVPGRQSATALERARRIPVVGIVAEVLTEYGERELRPLARVEPRHLAVAGIHSLHVALYVLARSAGRTGPTLIAETGGHRYASDVIANLAVITARAGERVLVIEDVGGEISLSTLLADDDETAAPPEHEVGDSLAESGTGPYEGFIRFLSREVATSGSGETGLPVPATTLEKFDRVLIHVGDVARARYLLKAYKGSVGLLVCKRDIRPSALRKAHAKAFHGVVLCGDTVDEAAYTGGTPVSAD